VFILEFWGIRILMLLKCMKGGLSHRLNRETAKRATHFVRFGLFRFAPFPIDSVEKM